MSVLADPPSGSVWPAPAAGLTDAVLLDWLDRGRRCAVATLVDVEGSAPLPAGATMLVAADGAIEGSITGGCVESAVVQEARELLDSGGPPRLLTYGVSDELAGSAGLTCGGTVHVFVHVPEAGAAGTGSGALSRFLADALAGRPAALATLLDGPDAGAQLALCDGAAIGSLRGGRLLDRNATEDLRGLLAQGRSAMLRYDADGSKLGAVQRVHLRTRAPAPQLVVVGAIDFSAALAAFATPLGYRVTICDPRAAFAASPRFSRSAEVVVAWPQELLAARELGPRDAVLVFSHDPKLDVPAVVAALAGGAGYVGALGSRRTTADRERRLLEAGVAPAALARFHAPCGLDIGSATPEETAIAVLAEIVAARAGRTGTALKDAASPSIRAQPARNCVGFHPSAG